MYVDGAPFYAVAGEVHNSDSSSPEYMEKIWKIADDLVLNTVPLPVTWELAEPEEGTFDFAIPDALIHQARQWGKKIIFQNPYLPMKGNGVVPCGDNRKMHPHF